MAQTTAIVKRVKKRDHSNLNSKLIRTPIKKFSWLFVGPTVIAFIIGFVWPFIQGAALSFAQFNVVTDAKFLGFGQLFANYGRALSDPGFLHAFWYTALFTLVSTLLINVLAFAVAYALTQGIKGNNIFRTVFFMPNLIGGIVLGHIWSMIFDGILSHAGTNILEKSQYGFWGLIILMLWQQIGYMMIIYIAGLQAIPEDMMEAAKIDGANKWQTLWKITIPNVMSSITICTFLTLSNGFKLFDQNLALTAGEPITTTATGSQVKGTEMLALNIYNTFTSTGRWAHGVTQAKSVIFFILVALIGLLQLKFTREREVQQ